MPIKKRPDHSAKKRPFFGGPARKDDGSMEVTVSADAMLAEADLYPPVGDGAPLTRDYAAELLARLGVTNGVLWEELGERMFEANTERRLVQSVTIARGTPAVDEEPEHIVPDERLLPGFVPVPESELSVDWKAINPFSVVKSGDVIGRVLARREGVAGSDVYGRPIAYRTLNPESYALGERVERRDDTIVATADGKLNAAGNKLTIDEVLVVKGDVDYRVGHIMFPGDVIIEGGVAAGFKVYSGGSITIKETMDAFDVSAKKDLTCAQGIIGKERGLMRVGGKLKAKFMENARCAVRGDAEIPGSVVGSSLFVLGKLNMGDKGRIVGGEVHATHGVLCGWIGGPTRPLTEVNVGVDFTIQQKLDAANRELNDLSIKLSRAEAIFKQRPEDSVRRLRDELQKRLAVLAESITQLSQRVDVDEGAVVEVRGGVYPGTTIAICHVAYTVSEPLKKTRFRLDSAARKILVEH